MRRGSKKWKTSGGGLRWVGKITGEEEPETSSATTRETDEYITEIDALSQRHFIDLPLNLAVLY